MNIENFLNIIGSDFYTGVPDSQLKALCNYLIASYGVDGKHHIIAANEGNCAAIAAGYHLATGKTPVVYMQNSGIGNIINPVTSLLNDNVYGIPCIFIVGWRGEPGVPDEPQHVFQGKITLSLLENIGISTFAVNTDTSEDEIRNQMVIFSKLLTEGKQVAFVIKKDALSYSSSLKYQNNHSMLREEIIRHITDISKDDIILSTTGKASRELFEIREEKNLSHCYDFLTVGSMGHTSSIALGIALQKPKRKVWIIDGDGAALMHMGAMTVIGSQQPKNIVHVVINNEAHESVGGQPTAAHTADLSAIAKACGYNNSVCVSSLEALDHTLYTAKKADTLSFIEVKCAVGARSNLGRPTTTPQENKISFMKNIK